MRRMVPLIAVLVLASCSTADESGTTVAVDRESTTTSLRPSEDTSPEADTGTEAKDQANTVAMHRPAGATAFPPITTMSESSRGGAHPELSWEAVPGTELYAVALFDPDGRIYWSWQGDESAVHVGGEPQLSAEAAGPSVVAGMSWQVLALDAEGSILAVSDRIAIDP